MGKSECTDKLLSIIIPVKNGEKTIHNCIKSIIDQNYEKIEVIIVDDGSVDQTKSIIYSFMAYDDRIIYLQNQSVGVSAARNYGIMHAKGEYICFVDADDTVEKEIYSLSLNELNEHGADMVIFDITRVESSGKKKVLKCGSDASRIIKKDIKKYILNYGGYTFNKIIKKEKMEGILFDESIYMCEDLLFWFSVCDKVEMISYVNQPLYNYITSENSICDSPVDDRTMTFIKSYQRMLKHSIDSSLQEKIIYMWVNNIIVHINRVLRYGSSVNKTQYLEQLRNTYRYCFVSYKLCFKQKLYYRLLIINPKIANAIYQMRLFSRSKGLGNVRIT